MKIVFFGTPDFAVPTLRALLDHDLAPRWVVSQPDRPVGRGRRLQAPPVAALAAEEGLELRQPEKVRDPDFRARLAELEPDVAVVVAYGQIFPKSLLALPRLGCVNLHASLLPRWRGAAPIQAAIASGDRVTGVTTMKMEAGLDTGPVLRCLEVPIGEGETTPELSERLAAVGAGLMVETLVGLADGTVVEEPQDDELATYAPRLDRSDGVVDWALSADRIHDRWRAFQPWPGLVTELGGQPLKLKEVRLLERRSDSDLEPGALLPPSGGVLPVVCGFGTILGLVTVQRPGRRPVSAVDLFHGERRHEGERAG